MLFLVLKLKRGFVVEDFFTVAKVHKFHSNFKLLRDVP